ncbi:MAG: 50S ribosomal protein L32 [Chlorobiales bacterium]|nr:50S ribosomal protein L32 [Chlorobiales bacterium]
MALPKRKASKGRRNRRRSHDALTPAGLSVCPECQEQKLPHRACPSCGYYNGKAVLEIEEE